MTAKTTAIFALGFASGMAALGVALWSTGHLVPYRQEVAMAAPSLPVGTFSTAPVPAPGVGAPVMPELAGSASRVDPRVETHVDPRVDPLVGARVDLSHLAMPLENIDAAKLTSNFHSARGGHEHEALDIMAPRGTPVHAVAEGNVVKLFNSKQGGLTVYQFDNSRTWCYYYAHLDRYEKGLTEGVLLRKGDVLGYVGSTGDASPDAPHLHFAVFRLGPEKQWWKGTAVDPLPLLK